MGKKISLVRPALTLSKHGKLGLRGPLVRLGGLNLSRSGPSLSQKIGNATLNTRQGLRMPLAGKNKKPSWPYFLGLLLGLICLCLGASVLITSIDSQPTRTPTPRAPAIIPSSTATSVPTRIPTLTSTIGGEVCSCSSDQYKCDDFQGRGITAQQCFDYCMQIGAGDVHQLDQDGDGQVCENP